MTTRRLWIISAAFILYGGTIPFDFIRDWHQLSEHVRTISWNPLLAPGGGRRVSIPDVVQNVLLFLPFGVLGVLAGRQAKFTLRRIAWVTLLGAGLSVLVEVLQLFTVDRTTSMSDVATNTAGTLLGAIAAHAVAGAASAGWARARLAGLTENTAFRPWIAAAILILVAAWQPFDVTLEVGTVVSKARSFVRDPWQMGVLTDEGIAFLHYGLFGVATCLWLAAIGRTRAAMSAAVIGAAAAFGLEGSQLFITSRMPGLEDALVRAAGALVGAAAGTLLPRRSGRGLWLAGFVIATAAAAAMQQLSPFTIAPAYRPFGLMPFLSDYVHTTFETLSHVIELVLLYAPIGFLMRRTIRSPGRALAAALVCTLVIAAPVEYLQGWVVGRYPDLTDIGLSLAGGWLGVRVGQAASPEQSSASLPVR
ncbi:MAG TPA: VanZ family protein [Vicinamibacterales bacterium]|nr:VanZ family protein [Vicinamibacterales bacterium]